MEVYCPPNPDLEQLYIPPFDGDYTKFPLFGDVDLEPQPPQPEKKSRDREHRERDKDRHKRHRKKDRDRETDKEKITVKEEVETETVQKGEKKRHRKPEEVPTPTTPPSIGSPTTAEGRDRKRTKNSGGLFPSGRNRNKQRKPIGTPNATQTKEDSAPWTPEEDTSLADAVRLYGHNWDLACDILLSSPVLPSRRLRRTPSSCAERYRVQLQQKEGEKKGVPTASPPPSPPIMSPPATPTPLPTLILTGPIQFPIMEVIKLLIDQKKYIPGRLGTVAQTDQPAAPHPSHAQVCFSRIEG